MRIHSDFFFSIYYLDFLAESLSYSRRDSSIVLPLTSFRGWSHNTYTFTSNACLVLWSLDLCLPVCHLWSVTMRNTTQTDRQHMYVRMGPLIYLTTGNVLSCTVELLVDSYYRRSGTSPRFFRRFTIVITCDPSISACLRQRFSHTK